MLKVFNGVVVDLVFLQEAVQFVARFDSEQATQLITGDAPLSVCLQGDGFQRRARRFLAGGATELRPNRLEE